MFGGLTDFVKPGTWSARPPQVIDRIGEYERPARSGSSWRMRAPFDWDGLELFVRDVMPAFR